MPEKRYRSTFYHEGKQYESTGKNQKEADQKAAVKLDKLKRGEFGISGNMTVRRWTEEWLETYKKPIVEKGTYNDYERVVNIILPSIGGLKIRMVKSVHLQKILNERAGKSKSDLSKLRMTMKAVFQRAYLSRLIPYNPAENLELPAAVDGTHRSITNHERTKILALAETHHAGLWVKTMLYCGLRPGETRALDWRHIDFNKKIIHVEQAMKAATKKIGQPKSAAGVRDIPIPDNLFVAFQTAKKSPFEPVFTQITTGRRHTITSMDCLWNGFKKKLDIMMGAKFEKQEAKDKKMRTVKILSVVADDLVPYCLRHTFCTDLQDAGVPINVARYLMGHANIAVTAKIYTHTTEKAIQDAAEKINTYIRIR